MSDVAYEKQVQDYYSKAPAIILGSGASAALGIPGMDALADHLIHNTDVSGATEDERKLWNSFCDLLGGGSDLESALHKVQMNENLTKKIILSTWGLINSHDIAIFRRGLLERNLFPLGRLLKLMFRSSLNSVDIITTNYDRLAEYSCEQERLHHFSGFTHGFIRQTADPSEIKITRKVNVWKVHGSLDWFKTPSGETLGLLNSEIVPENFEPRIVTPGIQKYHETHLEPYRSIINSADNAIKSANSFLCIGFGFNDEHIQPKLIVKCLRENVPITIISYKLTDAAKNLLFKEKIKNFVAIERGDTDDQSIVYSSLFSDSLIVEKNIWSLEGYLTIIS